MKYQSIASSYVLKDQTRGSKITFTEFQDREQSGTNLFLFTLTNPGQILQISTSAKSSTANLMNVYKIENKNLQKGN